MLFYRKQEIDTLLMQTIIKAVANGKYDSDDDDDDDVKEVKVVKLAKKLAPPKRKKADISDESSESDDVSSNFSIKIVPYFYLYLEI